MVQDNQIQNRHANSIFDILDQYIAMLEKNTQKILYIIC